MTRANTKEKKNEKAETRFAETKKSREGQFGS